MPIILSYSHGEDIAERWSFDHVAAIVPPGWDERLNCCGCSRGKDFHSVTAARTKSLSEILGHKNVSFTLNVYGRANLQQKTRCMNLLNDLL